MRNQRNLFSDDDELFADTPPKEQSVTDGRICSSAAVNERMSILSQSNSIDFNMVPRKQYPTNDIEQIEMEMEAAQKAEEAAQIQREMDEAKAAFSLTPVQKNGSDEEEEKHTAPLDTTAIDSIAVLSERLTPINQAPALQQTQEPINLLTPVQFDENYMPPKPKRMGTYDQERD